MDNENKLPPEFKQKWIDALRSGKYTQCKSELASLTGGYCCLGVACIVAGHRYEDLIGLGFIGNSDEHGVKYFKTDLVPALIQGSSVAGISYKLQQMNDVAEKSFNEIADYIEENL